MELPREKMTIIEPQNSFGTSFDEFNQESDDDDWFSTDDTVHVHTEPSEYQKAETPLIQTASEMFSQDEATSEPVKRFPPELFQLEMLITHPEYGAGKIIALSGQGKKRTATVEFFSGEEKKFRLAQSPLQPAVEP